MKFDWGFQAGIGAFETIAVYNKKPMFLREHIKRLNDALNFLAIQKTISSSLVLDYIEKTKAQTYALKIMVSEKNTILKRRCNPYLKTSLYEEGASLKYSTVLRNESCPLTYHKTLSHSQNILEKRKATKEGYLDAVFCNTKGFIAEGSTCNIFFVKQGQIFTPSMASGILPGIIRAYVIAHYEVQEINISKEFVEDTDACFITNSLMGIMPVRVLGEKIFIKNTKTFSNMIKKIMNDYDEKII